MAAAQALEVADQGLKLIHKLANLLGVRQQFLPRGGEAEPTAAALEQGLLHRALKGPHLHEHPRLREVQVFGGSGVASQTGHRQERPQLGKGHGHEACPPVSARPDPPRPPRARPCRPSRG